jgi:uncharacterized protein with GYD domain
MDRRPLGPEARINNGRATGREDDMAILIAQARFAADGPPGVAATPADSLKADRLEAANRLVANFGGTLIVSYRISGDHDVLLIFEAASYEDALQALGAAGSGLADLKIVRVLAPNETKPAVVESRTEATNSRSQGVSTAPPAAAEPGAHTAAPGDEGTTGDADSKAATRILDARKKAAEDIAAGRPAPYYLSAPMTPAPPKPARARASKDDDPAKKQ